jgi:hypothetical protein
LFAPCPTLKMEDRPFLTVCDCDCSPNIFTATLHMSRPSPPSEDVLHLLNSLFIIIALLIWQNIIYAGETVSLNKQRSETIHFKDSIRDPMCLYNPLPHYSNTLPTQLIIIRIQGLTNNHTWTDAFVLVLNHVTIWFSSFVSNGCDSVALWSVLVGQGFLSM